MPQSLSRILVHLVFRAKDRVPMLTPAIRGELHPYLAVVLRGNPPRRAVVRSIRDQETHHRRATFQEELCRTLERYQVAHDERYLWE